MIEILIRLCEPSEEFTRRPFDSFLPIFLHFAQEGWRSNFPGPIKTSTGDCGCVCAARCSPRAGRRGGTGLPSARAAQFGQRTAGSVGSSRTGGHQVVTVATSSPGHAAPPPPADTVFTLGSFWAHFRSTRVFVISVNFSLELRRYIVSWKAYSAEHINYIQYAIHEQS